MATKIVNTDLLRLIMRKKRISQRIISKHLQISESLLCAKIKGRIRFHDYQVAQIRDLLGLTPLEVTEIFYNGVVLGEEGITHVSILRELSIYIELISHAKLLASPTLDQEITAHVVQKFLSEWIRNPDKNTFIFDLTEMDVQLKNKFFALSEIMLHKIHEDHSETVARLFESININKDTKQITFKINNKSIRGL